MIFYDRLWTWKQPFHFGTRNYDLLQIHPVVCLSDFVGVNPRDPTMNHQRSLLNIAFFGGCKCPKLWTSQKPDIISLAIYPFYAHHVKHVWTRPLFFVAGYQLSHYIYCLHDVYCPNPNTCNIQNTDALRRAI